VSNATGAKQRPMMAEPEPESKKYRCVAGHLFPGSKPGVVPARCPLCGGKVEGNIRGSISTK